LLRGEELCEAMEPQHVNRRTDECDEFPEPWREVRTVFEFVNLREQK
jgi:hypothetical protein